MSYRRACIKIPPIFFEFNFDQFFSFFRKKKVCCKTNQIALVFPKSF